MSVCDSLVVKRVDSHPSDGPLATRGNQQISLFHNVCSVPLVKFFSVWKILRIAGDSIYRYIASLDISEPIGYDLLRRFCPIHGIGWQDRKSTRLNSSHLGISYA